MNSVVIHGHFYQPPRENPWTGAIDREESASPWHDWNERIHAECYRPNAFARIIDGRGRVERIVNNYLNLSFDFGPTVLSWLERTHPAAHAAIVGADRESVRRRHGHGNAIAHAYSHPILPLCNERDLRTQVIWGIADFRHRFGREPEALWLPETACNDETLATLIEAGMAFVILSPYQAERVRPLGSSEWRDVSDGSIDPRVAYRYFHSDGSGRSIAIFFYDDPLARAIAFEGALASSENLVERLRLALGQGGKLVNVATDGESYGHHFHFGDRCIAYALEVLAGARGLKVTNYGEFLEPNPPRDEVEIKPGPGGKGTSWSCAHGVGRWYRDCGCQTGGQNGWNQAWRGPLRTALDFLRDRAAQHFDEIGGDLFGDPWAVRDAYIELVLDPKASRESFLSRHARRSLDDAERIRALDLLEMQRAAMLMYASCGWFFSELSGIETVQVMRYAGRVLDFMEELGVDVPLESFLERLAEARSNISDMGNGADVYRRFVEPSRATPRRVAAHLAMTSLADYGGERGEVGDYAFSKADYVKRTHGRLTLATGRLLLTARTTGRRYDFAIAALHLGDMDFYCSLKPYPGAEAFKRSADSLSARFKTASLPTLFRMIQAEFGPDEFAFDDVLPDGRWAICEMAFGYLSRDLTAEFMRIYEQNRRIIEMLYNTGFELPSELRIITEFALGRRFEQEIREQGRSLDPRPYAAAFAIADEIARHHYQIDRSASNQVFSEMIAEAVRVATAQPREETLRQALDAIALAKRLRLEPNLEPAQETVYHTLVKRRSGFEQLGKLAAALGLSPEILKREEVGRPAESLRKRKVQKGHGLRPTQDGLHRDDIE